MSRWHIAAAPGGDEGSYKFTECSDKGHQLYNYIILQLHMKDIYIAAIFDEEEWQKNPVGNQVELLLKGGSYWRPCRYGYPKNKRAEVNVQTSSLAAKCSHQNHR
ncbi:hypothetical protein TorRG33x02_089320 [Trema orientale]|uniref:Uncharacterized protein n=1 Tax=Trema orientale TaxID=63057 RepID=A0A2P5FC99_TREOI|nr:hypothetical protein TorRG33x02_089320 [Trema orientale]